LIQAAAQLYAGRYKQALQQAASLRHETRGFRLVEIRRLSIIATAQFQAGDTKDSLATLEHASRLPRGLSPNEVDLFNPIIRDFAEQHVGTWPPPSEGASTFLVGLAEPGPTLTEREIEILGHLARGHTREHIAGTLSISLNTVKTQLRSIFYKLKVSSAADAVQQGQRRGII
ncbi:MAG: helix-turn-helix transcriptional regulator, partial [Yaniella sp.]|nr:helix-turn-helix transcriptional regulator [Yaniella sp.]